MAFANGKGRGDKYGAAHQAARKAYGAQHQPHHPCVRCGRPLGPLSPSLHLDHDEHGGYLGFSHRRCNERAGARKGAGITNARRRPHPREW